MITKLRTKVRLLLAGLCTLLLSQLTLAENKTVHLLPDTASLLRNPCMGWGLYDDASGEVQDADLYWKAQDEAARQYGSFFYVRWRWSDMEPEEGKYAWLYDENYKKLIKGARDRGLKLCFRVYNHSQDNLRQSTPDYVRKAGAKGYMAESGGNQLWTPYPDDPLFLSKLETFIQAFAREYDDPGRVDFIDGYNIGWWGECHNIRLLDPNKLESVFDRITTMYASNFKKVLLALPFNSQIGIDTEMRIAITPKGYVMRRDGLGSMWFTESEQKITRQMYGKTLLIGESCWWQSSSDSVRPFATDKVYKLNTWRDVYELTFKQAVENGFNTLDLREIPETSGWTGRANDLVRQFIAKGGYRFYPSKIALPVSAKVGENAVIEHTWNNLATGYLPNNVKNWNYKYKPAFALLDDQNKVVKCYVDKEAEPSSWFQNEEYGYRLSVAFDGIPSGTYKWAVAIIDQSTGNTPGINLAIDQASVMNGWTVLEQITLTQGSFAQDYPANPIEKEGYRLIFQDEFDGNQIDRTKWIPEYLPSWPKDRRISSPTYEMKDGIMKLIIDKKSDNEFDNGMYITGFMSASRTGMHHYDPKKKALHQIKTEATQINQYGYYEMRAKMQTGGGVHCAWWLIGFEDDPNQSCEIDIFEILGTEVDRVWATVHSWKDSTIRYHSESPWFANKKLADEYHVYGFDWTPEGVAVYVDGIQVMKHCAAITYPLIQVISFYDNRKAKDGWTGTYDPSVRYPKSFDIDYLRMYKKIPDGYKAVPDHALEIVSIDPAYLHIEEEKAEFRNIDGHITPELLYTPTFVNVHYNDGTTTQQFVEWEPLDNGILERVRKPGTVIVSGKITGLPASLLNNRDAALIITTK